MRGLALMRGKLAALAVAVLLSGCFAGEEGEGGNDGGNAPPRSR